MTILSVIAKVMNPVGVIQNVASTTTIKGLSKNDYPQNRAFAVQNIWILEL